jgi:hypothetical protein
MKQDSNLVMVDLCCGRDGWSKGFLAHMKQALLFVLLILSGCTRHASLDECASIPIEQKTGRCPEHYCVREYKDTPGGDARYDCVPEKCSTVHCTQQLMRID